MVFRIRYATVYQIGGPPHVNRQVGYPIELVISAQRMHLLELHEFDPRKTSNVVGERDTDVPEDTLSGLWIPSPLSKISIPIGQPSELGPKQQTRRMGMYH